MLADAHARTGQERLGRGQIVVGVSGVVKPMGPVEESFGTEFVSVGEVGTVVSEGVLMTRNNGLYKHTQVISELVF